MRRDLFENRAQCDQEVPCPESQGPGGLIVETTLDELVAKASGQARGQM